MGMFDFFSMADNYEQRKVGRFDADWGFVSTCSVNDADKPYETAVKHREYNNGKMVIVETYDTREQAANGHARWVETMTADILPVALRDVGRAGVRQFAEIFSDESDWVFPRVPAQATATSEARRQ